MNELIKKVNLTRQDVLHGSYEYLNSHRLIHQLYSTKLFTGNKTCMLVAKLSNYVTHTHFTPDEYGDCFRRRVGVLCLSMRHLRCQG